MGRCRALVGARAEQGPRLSTRAAWVGPPLCCSRRAGCAQQPRLPSPAAGNPARPADPDAPKYREWLHWIVTNIPAGGDATRGQEVRGWARVAPLPGSQPGPRRQARGERGEHPPCLPVRAWPRHSCAPTVHTMACPQPMPAARARERMPLRPLQVAHWRGPSPPIGTHRYGGLGWATSVPQDRPAAGALLRCEARACCAHTRQPPSD